MKTFNALSNPKISETNGLKRYIWENFQVKPALDDDNSPSWYDTRACVQVSEFSNWGQVADWALSINPPKMNITGELASRIEQMKITAGNNKTKYFRLAVKTVQDEVIYMGIEIGPYSHKANDPMKVFNRRYGDCKDKSLLLVSMLLADGIDAHMVLVNTDLLGHLKEYIPGNNLFNHAVVVANVNGKQIWVDATIDDQGGVGTNIYFPDYGLGLILAQGSQGLTIIPASAAGETVCEEKYTVKNEKSPVGFDVKTTYTLSEADDMRDRLASNGMAETEKDYLDYYAKTYPIIQ
jgi:transglutaminase-like putative cysteine protease